MSKNSIQFFGLPGSGKTTVLRSLVDMFPESYERTPDFTRLQRFWLFILFVARFPRLSMRFFLFILNNHFLLWSYLLHLISHAFACHIYVLLQINNQSKIFLIDEGLLQRLLSITPRSVSEAEARKLVSLSSINSTKTIIMYGGDFGRFVSEPDRMISARNKFGDAYFKKWSENMKNNFLTLSSVLIEKDNTLTADNTNKDNLAAVVTNLHEEIKTNFAG